MEADAEHAVQQVDQGSALLAATIVAEKVFTRVHKLRVETLAVPPRRQGRLDLREGGRDTGVTL